MRLKVKVPTKKRHWQRLAEEQGRVIDAQARQLAAGAIDAESRRRQIGELALQCEELRQRAEVAEADLRQARQALALAEGERDAARCLAERRLVRIREGMAGEAEALVLAEVAEVAEVQLELTAMERDDAAKVCGVQKRLIAAICKQRDAALAKVDELRTATTSAPAHAVLHDLLAKALGWPAGVTVLAPDADLAAEAKKHGQARALVRDLAEVSHLATRDCILALCLRARALVASDPDPRGEGPGGGEVLPGPQTAPEMDDAMARVRRAVEQVP